MAGSEADNGGEPVPKLPRGRGLKFSGPQLFRIAVTLSLLVAIVMLARPCANAVSHFVMGFGSGSGKGSGSSVKPAEPEYEHLTPTMTDDERRAAIERAKARAHATGSAAPSPSDSAPTPAIGSARPQ
ncbi:MAG: hypothetical protein JWO36_1008 [Myxococcales bacterium]|nr:hypothetical protein [Myxococcales bacterium]